MNRQTPLTEVAQHLPAEAAQHLLNFSENVQIATLSMVREMVILWENEKVELDPFTYSIMVASLASAYSGGFVMVEQLKTENARLQSLVLAADALIRKGR